MIRKLHKALAGLLFAGSLSLSGMATAGYTDLFIFGDSLSDTGVVYALSGGAVPPSPPAYAGRFSNGPVWVETLAAQIGLPNASNNFLAGGNNFAIGGARTGIDGSAGPGTGILGQLFGIYQPIFGPLASSSALYVLGAGGNDLRDAALSGNVASAQAAALNMVFAAQTLAGWGASHILVANGPNVGLAPEVMIGDPLNGSPPRILANPNYVADALAAQTLFNATLAAGLAALEAGIPGLDIIPFDMAGILQDIGNDALLNGGALYGLTGTGGYCFLPGVFQNEGCAQSVFWDNLHPTAAVHAYLGAAAARAVPEPATLLLVSLCLLSLAMQRRRAA
ncbi:MAG: hypothetical protein C0522_08610 [Rhodocyclaceae bacterium]|jgi:phospholipase/lecithinase/hemolysin|nr:hypothetical protein [Rhodocyclaceae bacterium]